MRGVAGHASGAKIEIAQFTARVVATVLCNHEVGAAAVADEVGGVRLVRVAVRRSAHLMLAARVEAERMIVEAGDRTRGTLLLLGEIEVRAELNGK